MNLSYLSARVSLAALLAAVTLSGCASPMGTQTEGTKSSGWFGSGFFSSLTGGGSASSANKAGMAAPGKSMGLAQNQKKPAGPPKKKLTDDENVELASTLAKGREMEKQGNLPKAREAYELLIKKFPAEGESYHRLGIVADKQKKHKEAQLLFQEAIDRIPNRAEIHADLGFCLFNQGKLKDAEAQTIRAIQLDRRNPRFHNNLALIFGYQGRHPEAFEEFKMAGSEADALYNLAVIYSAQGRDELAKSCLERAVHADPQHEVARNALERFEADENMPEEMRQLRDIAVEDGKNTRPYLEGGDVAQAGGAEGGRVAQAQHAYHPRDAAAARREGLDAARQEMRYERPAPRSNAARAPANNGGGALDGE